MSYESYESNMSVIKHEICNKKWKVDFFFELPRSWCLFFVLPQTSRKKQDMSSQMRNLQDAAREAWVQRLGWNTDLSANPQLQESQLGENDVN